MFIRHTQTVQNYSNEVFTRTYQGFFSTKHVTTMFDNAWNQHTEKNLKQNHYAYEIFGGLNT